MFKQLAQPDRPLVGIVLSGRTVSAPEGEMLAAVLLREGFGPFRTTPAGGRERAAYCMMGVCFDCLVTIDGRPNRQACQERVRAGISVEPQQGAALLPANGSKA